MSDLVVVCYLWRDSSRDNRGYVLTPDHVRILRSMVGRNLTLPHRFVCVTDEDLDFMEVDTVPLDWTKHVPGTVFMRLMQHNPDIIREPRKTLNHAAEFSGGTQEQ